jgi:hypothetical protein
VPVVRDADLLSLAGIEKTSPSSAGARAGSLTIEEMQGGTFTISNGGVYGSLMSTPILNAPQSGILGMHKIQQRPMVVDGRIEIPADDVSGAELRSPDRRRQGSGDLPGADQGRPRGPAADDPRHLAQAAGPRQGRELQTGMGKAMAEWPMT